MRSRVVTGSQRGRGGASRTRSWCWPVVCGGLLWLSVTAIWITTRAGACPFCAAIANTLTDDMRDATVAVLAQCLSAGDVLVGDELPPYHMRVEEVLKGDGEGLVGSTIRVYSFDPIQPGATCLVISYGEPPYQWSTPTVLTASAVEYLRGLRRLPEQGGERLTYFLRFLESPERLIADDAYNEFARSTLADVTAMRGALDRDWVLARLRSLDTPVHRRRLYWTFLGLCGRPEDAAVFDELVDLGGEDPTFDPGLDAAIACYLTLGGEPALARIESRYLGNPQADYTTTCSAIMALRVHGEEMERFSRQRLATALHRVLERPELADVVIPDLARWEDWSVMDRLVELFLAADDDSYFVRVPVANYLQICPLPAAQTALSRLREVDPEAIRQAEVFLPFQNPESESAANDDGGEQREVAEQEDDGGADVAVVPSGPAADEPAEPARSAEPPSAEPPSAERVWVITLALVLGIFAIVLAIAVRKARNAGPGQPG